MGFRIRPARTELGAIELQADRASALERQESQCRLHRQLILTAERAADRTRHHTDAVLRNAENARKLQPIAGAVLAANAYSERAIGFRYHVTALCLHEGMHLARRDVGALNDVGAAAPGRLDVAAGEMHLALEIAGGVDSGCARCERALHVIDDRKRLIRDADQCQGTSGRLLIDRSDRRDDVAGITHFVGAKRRLVLDDDAVSILPLNVLRGRDGGHARKRLGRRGVHRHDPRMRNAGAQDAPYQHAGAAVVSEVSEPPGDFVFDVGTNAPAVADDLTRNFNE